MPPPSRLAIATSSVTRLMKEETSYKKELAQQEERLERSRTETGDENAEYKLRQEVTLSKEVIQNTPTDTECPQSEKR